MAAVATMPLSLYDLEDHLTAMAESAETVTAEQEEEFLEEFKAALTSAAEKRDRVAHYLAHLEQQQEFAAKEIARLQKFKKSREAAQTRLEDYVSYCIRSQGRDRTGRYGKLEGNTTVMFLRACPASVEVTDIAAVPLEYQNVTVSMPASTWSYLLRCLGDDVKNSRFFEEGCESSYSVDKRRVKSAIEGGGNLPGVTLMTDRTTLIRS